MPSVLALSTTTVATGGCVWAASAASDSSSRSRRFHVTTTATTRGAHRRHPTDPAAGHQQALERSVASLAAYPSCRLPIEPPTVVCRPREKPFFLRAGLAAPDVLPSALSMAV